MLTGALPGRAAAGEGRARDALARHADRLARGLAQIITLLDPDVIVLGGGVGNIDELYTDGVAALRDWVFNTKLGTKVVRPELGDSAGVFGAAQLCLKR